MTSTETENNPNHENYLNAACQILKKCCELAPKNTSIAIFENKTSPGIYNSAGSKM